MKKLPLKQKVRKVKTPRIIFKLADISPEERERRLEDIYTTLFEETLKNFGD